MKKEDVIEFLKPNWRKLILPIFLLIVGLVLYFYSKYSLSLLSRRAPGFENSVNIVSMFNLSFLYRDLLIIVILAYLLSCLFNYLSEKFDKRWIFWVPISIILIIIIIITSVSFYIYHPIMP